MQCPKCGYDLPENVIFCGKCGADLSKIKKKRKKRGGSFWLKAVVAFVLGIAIGVFANHAEEIFVLKNNNQKEFWVADFFAGKFHKPRDIFDKKNQEDIQDETDVESAAEVQGDADAQGEAQIHQEEESTELAGQEIPETQTNEYQEETDISDQLIQSIETAADGKSVYSISTDYDADGTTEIFSIVGSKEEDELFGEVYIGEIWFANPYEAYRIRENDTYYVESVDTLEFDETRFFMVQKAVMTGSVLYVWGTEDSAAVEAPISGKGCSVHTIERVTEKFWTFMVEQSAYDGSADGSGHTWKPYYFYWDGEMHENGGMSISADAFCRYDGAEELLNKITVAGYTYTDIIYRRNNIVNINYHNEEGFNENATVKIENGKAQLLAAYTNEPTDVLSESTYGGVYMPAMIPEIVHYR